jgi:ABC-type bacteriocin/lantibiotic exporter with double-glycine peptidase domain
MDHQIQLSRNACGIAVIKMFLQIYEVEQEYFTILKEVDMTKYGVSLYSMKEYLEKYFPVSTYECSDFLEIFSFIPCIAVLQHQKKYHYVLIYKDNEQLYVADPSNYKSLKIKTKYLKKVKYILTNNIPKNIKTKTRIKFKESPFRIPLIVLELIEIFLLTISFFYLFSINDYTISKINTFLGLVAISFIITTLKNYILKKLTKHYDKVLLEDNISNIAQEKDNQKLLKLIQTKNFLLSREISVIPSCLILLISLTITFSLSIYMGITLICILGFMFSMYFFTERSKNKKLNRASELEKEVDYLRKNNHDIKDKYLEFFASLNSYQNSETQISSTLNILKQIILMLLLIIVFASQNDKMSLFIVTIFFFSSDALFSLTQSLISYKSSMYLYNEVI